MRARVSDDLRRQIEADIVEGRLLPGDRLDEKGLAQRFSVSRTPAREVLLRLAADGLVRFKSRQGVVVAAQSPQRAIGMLEVLTALEAEAARLAARRMSPAELKNLRDVHEASRDIVDVGDAASYGKANDAFHSAIYAGARNAYLAEQLTQTRRRMRLFRSNGFSRAARVRASWEEHGRVVEALVSGDEAAAQQAMRAHMNEGGAVFADMVSALQNEAPSES